MKSLLLLLSFFTAQAFAGTVDVGVGNATMLQGRAIATTAPTDTQVLTWDSASSSWKPAAGGGGSGSVTSVDMTVPTFLAVSGNPITTTGTLAVTLSGTALPVANGGTGLTAGTSGGVLAYTGTGTLVSSGALTVSRIVLGGGAGAAPTVLGSLGTTTTLLHGNAAGAPTFGAVGLTTDVTGVLPNANTTAASANTASAIVTRDGSGNFTAGMITSSLTSVQIIETVVAGGTCSTSYDVNPTSGTMVNLTLSGACAIGVTGLVAGHSFIIKLTQSSTTAPTFTSAYKWAAGTAPTWSTSATKYDMIACASLDGTTLQCNGLIDVR